MDPGFVERHWTDLPNLNRLRREGSFHRLGTTMPPQSPVAWSTFITGLPPAEHGIFDFVHRDPATLQVFSSMARTEPGRWNLPLGPYVLPLSAARIVSQRRGTPFWQTLWSHGVPVTVIRMPTNYPPLQAGNALAGMGTPDLRGTLGTFTFYTDNVEEISHGVSGGRIAKVHLNNGHVEIPVEGPPNTLRKDEKFSVVNLIVDVDSENAVARLRVGETVTILKQGEWSDWITADFTLIPHLASAYGMFRVFAKQLHPGFQIYVSAVNDDPLRPALPIAAPPSWSRTVARKIGRFFTLGTPEDTSALRSHALTHDEFLEQTSLVFEDERKLFRQSIRDFDGGFLFIYFSSIDQNSHILWGRYDGELLKVYREIDKCIGEARASLPNVDLIVMSDHGFSTFDRAANLNTWLRHRGYLSLKTEPGDDTGLSNIDWTATEAYAVGLNGLYLNAQGREAHGVVKRGMASEATLNNLREQLLQWRDPTTGRQVVTAVARTKPSVDNAGVAPDLIIGYNAGYRASWQTGVGATPLAELEDNTDEWIADHCIDPRLVPGVLFLSTKRTLDKPRISDVTELILERFRVHR